MSASGVSLASSADLRKADQLLSQQNIRITHRAPLEVPQRSVVNYRGLPHTLIDIPDFLKLDSDLRNLNFANRFKSDGCYAKSHLISFELSRAGILHSKVFIAGKKYGDIVVKDYPKDILFEFHVAPLVLVRLSNGNTTPFILDLSFFESPVQLTTWQQYFFKSSNSSELSTFIRGPEQIDPTWAEPKTNFYSVELLYRFETEIDAFQFILDRQKPN